MNLAEALNQGCACQTLEPSRLREQLESDPMDQGLTARLAQSHPPRRRHLAPGPQGGIR